MQLPRYVLSQAVLPALFHPGSQAHEAGGAGDIVNEEHRVDVAVVVLHHGLPKALLTRCVPELELEVRRGSETGKKVRQRGRKDRRGSVETL